MEHEIQTVYTMDNFNTLFDKNGAIRCILSAPKVRYYQPKINNFKDNTSFYQQQQQKRLLAIFHSSRLSMQMRMLELKINTFTFEAEDFFKKKSNKIEAFP